MSEVQITGASTESVEVYQNQSTGKWVIRLFVDDATLELDDAEESNQLLDLFLILDRLRDEGRLS